MFIRAALLSFLLSLVISTPLPSTTDLDAFDLAGANNVLNLMGSDSVLDRMASDSALDLDTFDFAEADDVSKNGASNIAQADSVLEYDDHRMASVQSELNKIIPYGFVLLPPINFDKIIHRDHSKTLTAVVFLPDSNELGIMRDQFAEDAPVTDLVFFDLDDSAGKNTLSLSRGTTLHPNHHSADQATETTSVFLKNRLLTFGTVPQVESGTDRDEHGNLIESHGFQIKKVGEKDLLGRNGEFEKVWTACRLHYGNKAHEKGHERWKLRWTGRAGLADMGECVGEFELEVMDIRMMVEELQEIAHGRSST
ncbi:hypothetical protein EX30DRAFT_338250 [Ascodesmis nigricans]|uniref:Uncharacterized protein n=1 Tax=Ascodesmis nigricans TaxID=341454 RepID=A0A4S2N3V8_9PEZI|nr:hypothetical protein EX30DRAFT_338250 [Ascodesmis nigricans]